MEDTKISIIRNGIEWISLFEKWMPATSVMPAIEPMSKTGKYHEATRNSVNLCHHQYCR
ncbi:MAG: hypothetical protein LBC19_06875 [Tannerella sp.]|nr:hypothetical protein [Tannerella sp.]